MGKQTGSYSRGAGYLREASREPGQQARSTQTSRYGPHVLRLRRDTLRPPRRFRRFTRSGAGPEDDGGRLFWMETGSCRVNFIMFPPSPSLSPHKLTDLTREAFFFSKV